MNETQLLFLDDTYLFNIRSQVLETGIDEYGNYIVVDQTVFYPQGGGQPADQGYLQIDTDEKIVIKAAKYSVPGVRHYIEEGKVLLQKGAEIEMYINGNIRKLHATYHTAGHWLSQLVCENLRLPLMPVKGHHFPGEAYIEFEGDKNCISPDTIAELITAMQPDLQADLKIKAITTMPGADIFDEVLLPKNFTYPENKPLRLTQIESYRWIPCGGTHLKSLQEIKSAIPTEFYSKGGKLRLKYKCDA